MANRKRKLDRARTHPLTLEFLRELGALKGFVPPTGAFDPHGTWDHAYRLWLVQPWRGASALTLRREPKADGIQLTVRLAIAERPGYVRRTEAVLHCADDPLCTPRTWSLRSRMLGLHGRPIPDTEVSETGRMAGDAVETRFAQQRHTQHVPQPATSHWALFDVVQRLPGAKTPPLKFTLLEEMDLVKPEQRLEFRQSKNFQVGGATLPLRGYQQTGRGVLPWQYWVDERGRLLFAFSGLRAYLWDPSARGLLRNAK